MMRFVAALMVMMSLLRSSLSDADAQTAYRARFTLRNDLPQTIVALYLVPAKLPSLRPAIGYARPYLIVAHGQPVSIGSNDSTVIDVTSASCEYDVIAVLPDNHYEIAPAVSLCRLSQFDLSE